MEAETTTENDTTTKAETTSRSPRGRVRSVSGVAKSLSKEVKKTRFRLYREVDIYDASSIKETTKTAFPTTKRMDCFKNKFLMDVEAPSTEPNKKLWEQCDFERVDNISYRAKKDGKTTFYWKARALRADLDAVWFVTVSPDAMQTGKVLKSRAWRWFGYARALKSGVWCFKDIVINLLFLNSLREDGQTTFAVIGSVLVALYLLIASATAGYTGHSHFDGHHHKTRLDVLFYIPIVNLSWLRVSRDPFDALAVALLNMCALMMMNFPIYLINAVLMMQSASSLSSISWQNWVQLANAIFSAAFTVVSGLGLFAERYSYFDKGLELSTKDKWLKIFPIHFALFAPIIVIEVTQFMPFIFYLYLENSVEERGAGASPMHVASIFLCARVVFVIHMVHHIVTKSKITDARIMVVTILFATMMFLVAPLVPYVFMLIDSKESKGCDFNARRKDVFADSEMAKRYVCLVMYLVLAYGGASLYVTVHPSFGEMSQAMYLSMCVVVALIVFVIVSFPKLYYLVMKYSFRGLDEYVPYDGKEQSQHVVQQVIFGLNS